MESFTASTDIDVPADQAWAVLADYTRDPDWRVDVLEMTCEPQPPVTAGTVTHEVIRVAGRTYRNTGHIDHVEPNTRLEWHTTHGAEARGAPTVRPLGDSRCQVTLELDITPHGINRLLAPLLRRTLRNGLQRDLTTLAELLVHQAPAAADDFDRSRVEKAAT